MTSRNFVPDPAKRKEQKQLKRLRHLEMCMAEHTRMNMPIRFYSLDVSFFPPKLDDETTLFMVKLRKPVKWRDIILRVSEALSDLL